MPNVGLTLILLYYMSSAQPVCSTTSELDSISDSSKSKRSYESASDADRVGNQAVDWPFSPGLGNTSLSLSTPHPYHADRIEKANWRPKVIVIGDNLAVNLTWRSRHSLLRPVKTYHVEYRRRPARSSRWSKPFSITYDPVDKPLVKTFCYITNKHLEAGMVYQFRVRTEFQNGDEERSAWSAKTSFSYISKVPPLLSVATRLPDGAIYVKWVLYKMRVNRLPNGETGYSGFQYVIVPGHLDEYQVSGLDSNSNYMFVVYGVHEPPQVHPSEAIFTGGLNDRKITQFSQEVFVPAEVTEPNVVGLSPPSPSSDDTPPTRPRLFDMNSTSSNSLMFLILGVLAGFMLTVMLALVAVCFCRQHREKLRLLAQMNSNTKDQPSNYNAPGGADDHPLPKTGEGAGKADSRLLVSYQPHPRQQSGFLLSELTPLAVANFRTATPTTTSAITPLTDSADLSLQSRRPPAHFFHPSNTNSPSRANGEVCGGGGGGGGRGDDQQQPMSLVVSLHGTAAANAAMVRGGTGDTLPAVGGGAFPSENAKPPQRANDLECIRSATSSRASNNSDSACSSFPPDPPAEAKREPPSGGSIHDESDDEENAGVALNLTPTKGLSSVFFTQMPFVLPAYPTTSTFEHSSFLNSVHSLSAAASQTPFSSGGGRRFSPIAGRRSKLLSPLMEPYSGVGETRTDGQVITRHGHRRTAAAFAALRTSGEEQALPLLQRSVLFPRSLLGRQSQRNRRTHSFGSATTTVPLADVELSVSRHQSPASAAALRIQAIVPNGPRCHSAGSRRSRSPTAYFPGLRIARCAGVAAAAPGSPKETDVAAPTPQPLPSARFQISPAPGLTPAMQSSCSVFPSPGQHSDTNASSLRPYQADAATQTGPLPVYPADPSRYSPPPENVAVLDGHANNDRDLNNSRPISTTDASLSGLPDPSGSERLDSVSVCALSQTDFVDPPDQLHSSPSAIKRPSPAKHQRSLNLLCHEPKSQFCAIPV
nr:unnamed protein product [Spirometra erinaceieuropaei]